jgi:N-acetylmuramoyl-L-alanine amidase
MGLLNQGGVGRGCGWFSAVAWVGLCCGGLATVRMQAEATVGAEPAFGMRAETAGKATGPAAGWDAAVAARADFEAEPRRTHTREEYARVMNSFRAIYHADPDNAHAAEAVAQVAELLAEQGREFGDKKNVHDAAGQYEYLAKAYPGDKLAPEALVKALGLLGASDADEAQRVRAQLVQDYPREARKAGVEVATVVASSATPQRRDVGHAESDDSHLSNDTTVAKMGHPVTSDPTRDDEAITDGAPGDVAGSRPSTVAAPVVREDVALGRSSPDAGGKPAGPLAVVTGIRHWSTASYTRVAIDLNVAPGEEIKYEAARVENPDRIFFDLGHARLAPELAGKSFNVTDDGFLTRVRAAQFSGEVTRVVLDVHHVAEYSAFLLPNPLRLIIDIHGGSEGRVGELTSQPVSGAVAQRDGAPTDGAEVAAVGPAPMVSAKRGGGRAVSSLPPMPVTDGSASFGLPARSTDRVGDGKSVAPPRVVIASKPTVARPVPNTVTKNSVDTSNEVAEVSRQPGMVEATRKPTSKPIAETSGDATAGDHYVPRSRRSSSHLSDDNTVAKMGHPGLSSGHTDASVKGEPAAAPAPTADGETSLMRALGLKIGRIVIDAGHGGHDSGTLGAGGIEEKDVVLDVALRLGKLLHDRLGAEVVYTRDDDTFVPLETRTAIANKAQADLFISVHANSSQDVTVKGVEVYYLNFASDPEAMTVASRENAVSTESVHELSDLVKKIALKDKIDESKELAADVDASLYAGLRKGNPELRNRGVKKAPFVVLIGANMPSILAEISFVTNPDTAEKLETPEYRERVAESLYKGIAVYAHGINGGRPRAGTVEQAAR